MSGDIFWRNDAGSEQARRSAVANGRKPDRFPDVSVRPRPDDDVIAAVRLAKKRGLKSGVRSGGHSWAASFLRDAGMLLDLSQISGRVSGSIHQTARAAGPGRRYNGTISLKKATLPIANKQCLER